MTADIEQIIGRETPYRCIRCDYPYTRVFSGKLFDNDITIDERGNLIVEIACEGCGKSTIFTLHKIKEEVEDWSEQDQPTKNLFKLVTETVKELDFYCFKCMKYTKSMMSFSNGFCKMNCFECETNKAVIIKHGTNSDQK